MYVDLDLDALLQPRAPKGGGSGGKSGGKSSGSKSGKGKGSKSKGGFVAGGSGGGNSGFNRLPVWARVLIVLGIIWLILFLISLGYYLLQEFRRKKDGKKFRLGRAFGKALLLSTGLWIVVWAYKKLAARRKSKSGSYDKIEEGHGVYAKERPSSDHDSWYGGAGAGGNDNKYDEHRPKTPVRPASPPAPAYQAPAATGAADDYYNNNLPQPPSHTAPTQHQPQYS